MISNLVCAIRCYSPDPIFQISTGHRGKVKIKPSRVLDDFTIKGVQYRGPLPKARSKPHARELEERIKLSVYDGEEINRKSITLGQFIDEVYWPWALTDYSTAEQSFGSHVRVVKAYFGSMPLVEITPARIEAFKQERIKTPTRSGGQRAPATVNRDLRTLSPILSKARENRVIKENPMSGVKVLKVDNRRERFMNDEEEEKLMAYLEHEPVVTHN